jgi:acid phosphatase family membrane protein YuiD
MKHIKHRFMKHYKTYCKTTIDEKLLHKPNRVLCGRVIKMIIIFIFVKNIHALDRFLCNR